MHVKVGMDSKLKKTGKLLQAKDCAHTIISEVSLGLSMSAKDKSKVVRIGKVEESSGSSLI